MSGNQNIHWIVFDHAQFHCRIKRIDDETYLKLARNGLCVNECLEAWLDYFHDSDNEQLKAAPLAFMLEAFERAYGKSGTLFDRYKGAFAFPFAVDIGREAGRLPYLFKIQNWRGSVECRILKVMPTNKAERDISVMHKPFEDEFSERQMNRLAVFLMGYAERFWMAFERNRNTSAALIPDEKHPDFVRAVDSNHILFGRLDGHLFQHQYSEHDEYEEMKRKLLTPYQQSAFEKAFRETFGDDSG